MITIGDKVTDTVSVTGTVIEDYGNTVVIEDDHAETEDSRLEFKKSQVKLLEEVA